MDPEFIYPSDAFRELPPKRSGTINGRKRAKSLLQNIASSAPAEAEKKKDSIAAIIAPRIPAEAEVPRRRAYSIGSKQENEEPTGAKESAFILSPLTKSERVTVRSSLDPEDMWIGENDSMLDEIDMANWYKYSSFRDTSHRYLHTCTKLLEQTAAITELINVLSVKFETVKEETDSFESACGSLVNQHSHLDDLVVNVDKSLEMFDRLEKATRTLNAPGSDIVSKTKFKSLLVDLDEGLEYVKAHKDFKDIDVYQMRFRQCMTRALTLTQSYINSQLRNTASSVQQQISSRKLNTTTQSALLYSRFEGEAERIKGLTKLISDRLEGHQEYYNLFGEVLRNYFAARKRLVAPVVASSVEEFASSELVQVSRAALSFFKQLCLDEYRLFTKHFDEGHDLCVNWLVDLCEPLYDLLRQKILREASITKLSELTAMLLVYDRTEAEELTNFNTVEEVDFGMLFRPILHDVQTRLVFRVQSYVDSDIVRYVPKSDDLTVLGHRRRPSKPGTGDNAAEQEESTFESSTLFQGWYPPMRKSITLLSQIYQLINSQVFDDLAHNIVHQCILSLQNAHALAESRLGPIEAQLFMIKNLRILSRQVSEFDIESIPAETQIDFSGLQDTFAHIRREGITFSGASILKLAKESVPRVVNNMLDAKEELYAKLRNAVHEFTEQSVKAIVGPIIDNPTPETAIEKSSQMRENATAEFPRLRNLIETYIEDSQTVGVLIDSIQDLVIQTYEQFHHEIMTKSDSPESLESLMEPDGLVAWLGDVVGSLYK
ncbi:conserved oligomeric Golgi complex subunit 3 [Trichomonascus vanleenenianus]|uniref:Golgi transport complex subunit COG3 n=1 Tax=Trichomonascus vanleenenianus TaxID=2268995 RepID=UPI003ECA7CBC